MAKETEQTTTNESEGRGSAMKTILVVVVVLLIEVGTIGVTIMVAGGPRTSQAQGLAVDEQAALNAPIEIKLLQDRFQSQRSGRPMIYDTEIWVTVRKKNEKKVEEMLDTRNASISVDVATIIRSAEPEYFNEKSFTTLGRQVKAALDQRFGKDDKGEPIVENVLIRKCDPRPVD